MSEESKDMELPPGCELLDIDPRLIPVIKWPALSTGWGSGTWSERLNSSWSMFTILTGITREEFTAMKEKADRCDWAEAALDEVRFAWGTEVADRDRRIAELRARVAELEGQLSQINEDDPYGQAERAIAELAAARRRLGIYLGGGE